MNGKIAGMIVFKHSFMELRIDSCNIRCFEISSVESNAKNNKTYRFLRFGILTLFILFSKIHKFNIVICQRRKQNVIIREKNKLWAYMQLDSITLF